MLVLDIILFNPNNHAGKNFISISIFQRRRLRLTELDISAKVTVAVTSGPDLGVFQVHVLSIIALPLTE